MQYEHMFKSPLHCTEVLLLWNSDTVKLTLGAYRSMCFDISIDPTTIEKISFLLHFYSVCIREVYVPQHACGPQQTTSLITMGVPGTELGSSCLVATTHQLSHPTSPRENYRNYLRTQKEHTSYEVLDTKAKRKTIQKN